LTRHQTLVHSYISGYKHSTNVQTPVNNFPLFPVTLYKQSELWTNKIKPLPSTSSM